MLQECVEKIIKLFEYQKDIGSFSLLGETGVESIRYTVDIACDKKFTSFWNSINR